MSHKIILPWLSAEKHRVLSVPVAQLVRASQEAQRLVFCKQRRLNTECVADFRWRAGLNRRVVRFQQHLFERLRVKRVLVIPGMIPGVAHQDLVSVKARKQYESALAPV